MKMKAILRLLACVAWAAVANARAVASPPQALDAKAEGELPVPKGWHIVAFTSPKAADEASSPAADQAPAAPLAPELAALNKLTAEQESEAKARAAKEVVPDAGAMLSDALGTVQPSGETEPVATASEVQPSAPGGSGIDGLEIPAGYRIEGVTPAAAAAEVSTPSAPLPVAAAAPEVSVPESQEASPEPVAMSAAGNSAEGAAAEAKTDDAPPATAAATSGTDAGGPAGQLKVDGLDVPAGWKITAILDDADKPPAASSEPPAPVAQKATPVAQKAKSVAEAKVVPMPAVKAAAISVKEVHAPAVAAAKVAEPVQEEVVTPKTVNGQAWPEALDEESLSGVGPVTADDASSTMAEMGVASTAEPVVTKMLNYVRGDQQAELAPRPQLPATALGHITSVECLTETLNNGGRPCGSGQAQVQAKVATPATQSQVPAAQPVAPRALLTKARAHPLKSITQVAAANAPAEVTPAEPKAATAETHTRLRAGNPAPVATAVVEEDKPVVARKVLRVVHHEHKQHAEQLVPAQQPQQQEPQQQMEQAPSMADLIAERPAV